MSKKMILQSIAVMMCAAVSCLAQEAGKEANKEADKVAQKEAGLPDLSKAFPGEKVLFNQEIAGVVTCAYMTDLPYAQLREKLLKYLGEGWAVEEQPEVLKKAKEEFEKQGMKLLGCEQLKNPAFANKALMFVQLEMPQGGGGTMAQITIVPVPGLRSDPVE